MNKTTRYIPDEMKSRRQWVLWKLETRGEHTTKIPYSVQYDGKASSTDPGTWGSYEQAVNTLMKNRGLYNGIGFVLTGDGLVFIDIDHSLNDRKLSDTAKDIITTLGKTYTEISQSGHGLHLFVRGSIPKSFNNRVTGVEMYSEGRFCAMTGNALYPVEPVSNQEGLDLVFNRYKTRDYEEKSGHVQREPLCDLSDRDIVNKASEKSSVFSDLYGGNTARYNSASEADFVLCLILAFWCDRDPERIDRIFRTSGLYREKWNRPDYRGRTISRACSSCGNSLSEYIKEQRQEAREVYAKYYA